MTIVFQPNAMRQFRGLIRLQEAVEVTLAFGGFLTDVIDLGGSTLVGIQTPATIAGNQFRFRAGYDDHHMVDLVDHNGNAMQAAYAANQYVELPEDEYDSVRFIQILTTTDGVPTNQAADITLHIICKGTM